MKKIKPKAKDVERKRLLRIIKKVRSTEPTPPDLSNKTIIPDIWTVVTPANISEALFNELFVLNDISQN